jgi:hypothetical protein
MSELDITNDWYEKEWNRLLVRWFQKHEPWNLFSRRDQVVLAVGYIANTHLAGNGWDLIRDMASGAPEKLAYYTPDAFDAIGRPEIAGWLRDFIVLGKTTGNEEQDEVNHEKAMDEWVKVADAIREDLGDECRVLVELYTLCEKQNN